MKIVSIICLLMISLSIQSQMSRDARDFLSGFLEVIYGRDFKLDDQCLGSDFESDLKILHDAVNTENEPLVSAVVGKMMNQINQKCPLNEVMKVLKDLEVLVNSGNFYDKIIIQTKDLIHCLKEEMNKTPYTLRNMGEFLGHLAKIVIYNTPHNSPRSHNLNFLAEEEQQKKQNEEIPVEEFVNGFFEGVSSVPFDQNRCIHDISSVKSQIVAAFSALIKAVETRSNIIEALTNLYKLTLELGHLDANCHFTNLSADIIALETKAGLTKLAFRITTHIASVLMDLKGAYSNYEAKLYKESGINFGSLIKITLNYSTI